MGKQLIIAVSREFGSGVLGIDKKVIKKRKSKFELTLFYL